MPGVTSNEFFPYPLMGETVNATSWANLANAVDAALVTLAAVAADAKKAPTVICSRISTSSAITVNTDTAVPFTNNVFCDPTSMHSTSVNTDQFVMPEAGIWYVKGSVNISAATTLTAIKAAISLNGTQVLAQQENPKSTPLGYVCEVNGVVLGMAAGDVLRLVGRWTGTGVGTLLDCYMHITRISKW